MLCTCDLVSFNGHMLQKYSTISQPGYGHPHTILSVCFYTRVDSLYWTISVQWGTDEIPS